MVGSKITSKYQTTVPKKVREELGVGPADLLIWDVRDGVARVTVARRRFLDRRGSIHVGPGSVVEDVRKARRLRGRESLGRTE